MRPIGIKPGSFVEAKLTPYSTWGVGKFVGATGGVARVQYFDAPGALLPDIVECPVACLQWVRLPIQTRVYRRHAAGRWQVGRVLHDEDNEVLVQFPNNDRLTIEAEQLQVRWGKPLQDPLPLLAVEATETPFLADARSEFVRQVSRQRAAAIGITALLSSAIDLVDYQFEVVRRVLTDPVQRYLLADEVGLGKTIEAGIIIRQYFLDEPEHARTVVVVPATLVQQWRSELSVRFGLQGLLDRRLHVVGHEDVDALNAAFEAGAGMLVVDEAHHLSHQGSTTGEHLYAMLQEHARTTPRLLLLSATPVLGDEAGFLRVLHLLDPVVFPRDDVEGLRRRIASRQVVAEVVAMLSPENQWSLVPELDRLEEVYGDDPLLMEKVSALRAVLETFPEEEDETFGAALADLRVHLVETYRLHRRLLRNRRATVSWATPRRNGLKAVPLRSQGAQRWSELLERLRLQLNADAALSDDVAAILLSAAVHPRNAALLHGRLHAAGVHDAQILALAQELDAAGERLRADPERFKVLVTLVQGLLQTAGVQVVVFCDRCSDAKQAAHALEQVLPGQVSRHEPEMPPLDEDGHVATPAWRQFLSAPGQIRVLVCDARAEEGVNLHGGKKLAVHFDLPLAPNRIEQRLGRLDRYGTGDPIGSYALVDEGLPDEVAWLQVLDAGWRVFNRSVASLQYLIESTARPLTQEWMGQGTQALSDHAKQLAGDEGLVQRELHNISIQDALDAQGAVPETALEALEECESDWQSWRDAFKRFAVDMLSFEQTGLASGGVQTTDPVFRITYVHGDRGRPTLITLPEYMRVFLQSVDRTHSTSRAPMTHRYAFRRQSTVSRAALEQQVYPLRVGDSLVTALERLCERDDRGRAFAMWRVDRQYVANNASGADLYFRFDFVVRPRLSGPELGEGIDVHAFARKAHVLMSPVALRVWIDGTGAIVHEPPTLLTARYSDAWVGTRRDFNLNLQRWRQLPSEVQSAWMRDWPTLCAQRRGNAESAVLASAEYRDHIGKALKACTEETRMRRAQAASRLARLDGAARERERQEMARDEGLYAALQASLSEPLLLLDVVGAVFVADDTPFDA